jgi:hypothetical protein
MGQINNSCKHASVGIAVSAFAKNFHSLLVDGSTAHSSAY